MSERKTDRRTQREWTVPKHLGAERLDRNELAQEIADLETHVFRGGFAATVYPIRVKYADEAGAETYETIGVKIRLSAVPVTELEAPEAINFDDEFGDEPFVDLDQEVLAANASES